MADRPENKNTEENTDKKQGITVTKGQIVALAAVMLLLIAGGFVLGVKLSAGGGDTADTSQSQGSDSKAALDIDPNAKNWTGSDPDDRGGDTGSSAGIKIPGYPSITIPKDTTDVRMALLNPEGNPCYFKFEIVLKDDDYTLYTSKLVPPGQASKDVELKKPLAEGEYDATIKITTLSLDGETPLNGANVETVLIVK